MIMVAFDLANSMAAYLDSLVFTFFFLEIDVNIKIEIVCFMNLETVWCY